jgi:hypothetical protein
MFSVGLIFVFSVKLLRLLKLNITKQIIATGSQCFRYTIIYGNTVQVEFLARCKFSIFVIKSGILS